MPTMTRAQTVTCHMPMTTQGLIAVVADIMRITS